MTKDIIPNKKTLLTMAIGLVVILLIGGWILTLFSALFTWLIIRNTPISQMQSTFIHFSIIEHYSLQVISIGIAIFAGGIVGYSSKKLGWFYGAIIGLLVSVIRFNFYPLLLIETLIGGWLGERIANSSKKKFPT